MAPTRGFGCARAVARAASSNARPISVACAPGGVASLVEEGIDIGLGVERYEIVDLFPGADETNRQIQLPGDGHNDAAFRGPVELGEHDAGDTGVAPEFPRLVEAVLAGGSVAHEKQLGRGARDEVGGGEAELFDVR